MSDSTRCLSCSSSDVVEGTFHGLSYLGSINYLTQAYHFMPTNLKIPWFHWTPTFELDRRLHACSGCGVVWTTLDADKLKDVAAEYNKKIDYAERAICPGEKNGKCRSGDLVEGTLYGLAYFDPIVNCLSSRYRFTPTKLKTFFLNPQLFKIDKHLHACSGCGMVCSTLDKNKLKNTVAKYGKK